jgi:hypothetical protein
MTRKRKCKFCGKLRVCREVFINGVSHGWWCQPHYTQYLNALDWIKKKHGCDDEEAVKIARRVAAKYTRSKMP